MKAGTILLVHGKDERAGKVQKWQMKNDRASGYYNHSAFIFNFNGTPFVIEADYIEGRKNKAAMVLRPLSKYTDHPEKYELLYRVPYFDIPEHILNEEIARINGVPYDYANILLFNPIQILTGWWWGRDGKFSKRRVNCHEGVMVLTNRCYYRMTEAAAVGGQLIFENAARNDVRDIYYNTYYIFKK